MFTIGADIEFLARRDGVPSSIIGIIGGTKDKPLLVKHGNLQEDNVLPELAIDPVTNVRDWVRNIRAVRGSLAAALGKLELATVSSAMFPEPELAHPKAKEFGCDPDFNAWTLERNESPNPHAVGSLRTCGGHIHVGYDKLSDDIDRAVLGQWMDVHLGLVSVLLDRDTNRRKVYGKAGSMRMKPYGMEYRTLSSFWTSSDALMQWAYRATERAVHSFDTQDPLVYALEDRGAAIQQAINSSDVSLAQQLIGQFNVEVPAHAG